MTSRAAMPAPAAGLLGCTPTTSAPSGDVLSCALTPSRGACALVMLGALPPEVIWCAMVIAELMGIANPTLDPGFTRRTRPPPAVFMPTTLPELSTSGPPESPGWICALKAIMLVSVSALAPPGSVAVTVWPSAVTVPDESVGAPPRPSALPIAVTLSPTDTCEESPTGTVGRSDALASCSTATSSVGSTPTTGALYVRPLSMTSTVTLTAPSTTWLLVRTWPEDERIMPVPEAELPAPRSEFTSTTAAVTLPVLAVVGAVVTCRRPRLTPAAMPAMTSRMPVKAAAALRRECAGGGGGGGGQYGGGGSGGGAESSAG